MPHFRIRSAPIQAPLSPEDGPSILPNVYRACCTAGQIDPNRHFRKNRTTRPPVAVLVCFESGVRNLLNPFNAFSTFSAHLWKIAPTLLKSTLRKIKKIFLESFLGIFFKNQPDIIRNLFNSLNLLNLSESPLKIFVNR